MTMVPKIPANFNIEIINFFEVFGPKSLVFGLKPSTPFFPNRLYGSTSVALSRPAWALEGAGIADTPDLFFSILIYRQRRKTFYFPIGGNSKRNWCFTCSFRAFKTGPPMVMLEAKHPMRKERFFSHHCRFWLFVGPLQRNEMFYWSVICYLNTFLGKYITVEKANIFHAPSNIFLFSAHSRSPTCIITRGC